MRTITTLVLSFGFATTALGQATTNPTDAPTDDGRPAPAAQRVEPVLDAWWQDAVFYEVFVRSFADSTTGPLANDGVGDLRGLIERLDYLNDGDPTTDTDLGVTALWLMPITDSPSYHGYDTTDYRRVEPDYGTSEDFRDLIEACHARGIRVTIDLVLNHCSSKHPWFAESAAGDPQKRDWFIWREDDPGYKGPWGQPVWHRAAHAGYDADGYFYGCFWSGMPDLNYANEAVSDEMLDVVRFWLEDMGADGFRMDAIRHLIEDGERQDNTPATHAWLRRYFDFVKSVSPEAMSVGEVWAPSVDVSRYVGDQMDLAFEFWLAESILESVRTASVKPFLGRMATVNELYPTGMYATFLRNHDQPRTMHALGGDVAAAKLAASIQFCLPGVPYIYYGEEIGMSADKPGPQIRTPMQWTGGPGVGFSTAKPWIAPKPDAGRVNVAAQTRDPESLLSHYRTLIRARRDAEALRIGALTPVPTASETLLAFRRDHGDARILCVFNLSPDTEATWTAAADALPFDKALGPDLLSETRAPRGRTVKIPPRSAFAFPVVDR